MRSELESANVEAILELPPGDAEHKEYVDFYYLQQKSYHGNSQISFTVFEQASQVCLSAWRSAAKASRIRTVLPS